MAKSPRITVKAPRTAFYAPPITVEAMHIT